MYNAIAPSIYQTKIVLLIRICEIWSKNDHTQLLNSKDEYIAAENLFNVINKKEGE